MREVFTQETKLTSPQEKVLKLVLTWLERQGFSEEDCQKAKDLWLGYLKNMDSSSDRAFENANLWAAAVLYLLGKQRGDQGLNLSYLALAFDVSTTRISVQGEKIAQTIKQGTRDSAVNLGKFKNFFPSEQAAKAFHELITYTQRSEQWMADLAMVFEEFMLQEPVPLSLDLLLELLLFATCDRRAAGDKSIIDLFLEENEAKAVFGDEELTFLRRLRASRFSLFQSEPLRQKDCPTFIDIFRGDKLSIDLDKDFPVPAGIMMGRVLPVTTGEDHCWQPGIYLYAIPPAGVDELEMTAKRWFWQYSVAHQGWATGEAFIRENGFRFCRWYRDRYPALR
ncbi:MAG TPA: hypothetical protein GXZ98_00950 [Firmicutes bacterium]|nr:hypothetical protein [Bacillota bacterium]